MKGNLHRSIDVAAGKFAALFIAMTAGCAASPTAAVSNRPDPSSKAAIVAASGSRSGAPSELEASVQAQAQRAWCGYLEALYQRAHGEAIAWPMLKECVAVKSTAAPEVLTQTADCALHALSVFVGDPFTAEYASEVSRCGVAALNAAAVTSVDLDPFIAALCGRAAACGQLDDAECRESFTPVQVMNLQRAVGAMNRGGREQLRACLRATSCEALQGRILTCIEPILDQLLWLPD